MARRRSDQTIQKGTTPLDCFAEPVIDPRDFARVRRFALTKS